MKQNRLERAKVFFKKLLKSPTFYFCFLFIITNLLFTKQALNVNGIGGFVIIAIVEILIECSCLFALYKMRRRGTPIEKQFLFLALALGALFIILLPPGQSPDEITHFRRAYGISKGILVPDKVVNYMGAIGSEIPKNTEILTRTPSSGTYELITSEITREDDELVDQPYTSAALYNFICYIPQTFAALIGSLFGFSILGTAYLMSIFNYLVWIVLIYYAVKLIPKYKSIVLFVSLLPITLHEATSISPDALTIGLSVFMVSYILYLAYGKRAEMKKIDYAVLSLSALIMGFCKIVYLPLIFLMVVIPKEKFGTGKKKWIFLSVLFGIVCILNFIWLLLSARYLVEYRPGVNSKGQLIGILKNPLKYCMVIFRTTNAYLQEWLSSLLGLAFNHFRFHSSQILFVFSLVLAVILFVQRDETVKLKKYDRAAFLAVFLIIAAFIFTSLYMQWTPQGTEVVEGIQGRYFLPLIILLPIILCRNNNKKLPTIISEKTILYYGLFINIISCIAIFAQNA